MVRRSIPYLRTEQHALECGPFAARSTATSWRSVTSSHCTPKVTSWTRPSGHGAVSLLIHTLPYLWPLWALTDPVTGLWLSTWWTVLVAILPRSTRWCALTTTPCCTPLQTPIRQTGVTPGFATRKGPNTPLAEVVNSMTCEELDDDVYLLLWWETIKRKVRLNWKIEIRKDLEMWSRQSMDEKHSFPLGPLR